jgi:quinol monooxygenase YgiN
MASPAVASIGAVFASNPTLLKGGPVVHNLRPAAAFTRPTISEHTNPYIVFATLSYKPGTRDTGLEGFARVCKATEAESGTLSYNILADNEDAEKIRTIEAYESESYLWDLHAKSEAVQGNAAATKDLRTNLEFAFLKMVAGFLHPQAA